MFPLSDLLFDRSWRFLSYFQRGKALVNQVETSKLVFTSQPRVLDMYCIYASSTSMLPLVPFSLHSFFNVLINLMKAACCHCFRPTGPVCSPLSHPVPHSLLCMLSAVLSSWEDSSCDFKREIGVKNSTVWLHPWQTRVYVIPCANCQSSASTGWPCFRRLPLDNWCSAHPQVSFQCNGRVT